MCLNARSIINKKSELNIMVDDIKPHIIGITESWANNDITDAELGLEGYGMFRKDRISQEEIELNPLKKHVFEVFAFLASLRHLVNISG